MWKIWPRQTNSSKAVTITINHRPWEKTKTHFNHFRNVNSSSSSKSNEKQKSFLKWTFSQMGLSAKTYDYFFTYDDTMITSHVWTSFIKQCATVISFSISKRFSSLLLSWVIQIKDPPHLWMQAFWPSNMPILTTHG